MTEILEICREKEKIVCYGAANFGLNVKDFLAMYNIQIEFYVVTEREENFMNKDGVRVFSLEEAKHKLNDCLILLSLAERYHMVIKKALSKLKCTNMEIYSLSQEENVNIFFYLLNCERKNILFNLPTLGCRKSEYDERIKEMEGKYEKIFVKNACFGYLGTMAEWIFFFLRHKQQKQNIFELLFPYKIYGGKERACLDGANSYLLNKCRGIGIEILSKQNLDFWRYALSKRKEKFRFITRDKDANSVGHVTDNKVVIDYIQKLDDSEYITFTDKEETLGCHEMKKMKIVRPYVCVSARTSYFIGKMHGVASMKLQHEYRNSSLVSRCLLIEQYLRRKQIQAVHMGADREPEILCNNLIPYATRYRTEFLDLYLAAKCKFFMCDLNGITTLAVMFSKPILLTNVSLLTTRGDVPVFCKPERDIAILKKFWHPQMKRYLTLREMLNYEVKSGKYGEHISQTYFFYEKENIIAIENTEEEILDAGREMNERIDGIREYSSLDIELQYRYREIVDNYPLGENVLSHWRLGADFLRNNQWLLD